MAVPAFIKNVSRGVMRVMHFVVARTATLDLIDYQTPDIAKIYVPQRELLL